MNLNKYLECTCTKIKPRLLETDEIKRIFEDLLLYILEENDCEPVILHEIYSTQVYPRYIRIDKKYYIIWDNYFWDLYRHFLIICFSVGDLK